MNNFLKYFNNDEINSLKDTFDMYSKAKTIVGRVFKDKVDKANQPYVKHLYRVSDSLDNYDEKIAGLLHDIIEDTEINSNDLIDIGFTQEIVKLVEIVTKDYDSYNLSNDEKLKLYNSKIDRIIDSKNISAIRIKIADISDNYNIERLKELDEDSQLWFEKKYKDNLIKLKEAERKIV